MYPHILEWVTSVTSPAFPKFDAAEYFREESKEVDIILSGSFIDTFRNKVEENIACSMLLFGSLVRNYHDDRIVSELGSSAKTNLAHLYDVIKFGVASRNLTSIFYIPDGRNVVFPVSLDWVSGMRRWRVDTSLDIAGLPRFIERKAGDRIVSKLSEAYPLD